MSKSENRRSLYAEVTSHVIAELEAGRLPWVQPWDSAACGCVMPANAVTGRRYSGISVLILWAAVIEGRYSSQRWLTYRQAQAAGGNVRKGERGTTVCYADRFTPKDEAERARDEDRQARTLAFLKRFTVFNVDQREGLPERLSPELEADPIAESDRVPLADALIEASGDDIRIGGGEAYYNPSSDYVAVPPQLAFHSRVNWYRTALHELGHWTGHSSRLGRDQRGAFGSAGYAREELVALSGQSAPCLTLH
jgi:antirestriction protein ArdC